MIFPRRSTQTWYNLEGFKNKTEIQKNNKNAKRNAQEQVLYRNV